MKKLAITVVVGLACMCLIGPVACGGDGDNGETGSTVSGALTMSAAPDGAKAYLKLVAQGGDATATALYFAVSAPFSGGSATYNLPDVEDGSYTGWAFIDVNGNAAGDATSSPDSGDYVTEEGGDITVSGDLNSDIPEDAWIQI